MPDSTWQGWRQVAQALDHLSMELEDFLALYPGTTRKQLARIARCEITTVNNWFAKGSSHRPLTDAHKLRFAVAHWLKQEPAAVQELRGVIDERLTF